MDTQQAVHQGLPVLVGIAAVVGLKMKFTVQKLAYKTTKVISYSVYTECDTMYRSDVIFCRAVLLGHPARVTVGLAWVKSPSVICTLKGEY